jgi:hypothetical protein
VVDGGQVLRHPDRADDLAVVRHRHGRVEQVLAERVAVPLALRADAAKRGAQLRAGGRGVRDRLRYTDRRVGQQPAARGVHDDHAAAEIRPRRADDLRQPFGLLHPARCARRDDECLPGGLVLHLGVDSTSQVERERHLERDDDQQQHVGERGEQLKAEAHSISSGDENRKPTPRTVCR